LLFFTAFFFCRSRVPCVCFARFVVFCITKLSKKKKKEEEKNRDSFLFGRANDDDDDDDDDYAGFFFDLFFFIALFCSFSFSSFVA